MTSFSGVRRASIWIITLAAAACAVAEPRVADNAQIAAVLRAMNEKMVSEWEVLDFRPGRALIASPPRPHSAMPGFCVRESIELGVDGEGRLLAPEKQLEDLNGGGAMSIYQMFALSDHGSCGLGSAQFFRARSLNGTVASPLALHIARDLATKAWANSSNKYRLDYLDDESRRCMKSAARMQILLVLESDPPPQGRAYRVDLGGCWDSAVPMVVMADVVYRVDSRIADVSLHATSKVEYACLQRHCWSD